jgi:hypothetical protein
MDTLKFALALEAADMNPEQAAIIASEFFAIYRHAVLGGAYVPVDYGDFDVLSAKAKAVRDKKEAMNNELRAMLAEQRGEQK